MIPAGVCCQPTELSNLEAPDLINPLAQTSNSGSSQDEFSLRGRALYVIATTVAAIALRHKPNAPIKSRQLCGSAAAQCGKAAPFRAKDSLHILILSSASG